MEFLSQYEILLKKSRSDLKAAKNLFRDFENGDEELDLEIIMFHLQQSTEKSLKALLSFNRKHFTKTHDLENLLNVIKENNIQMINDTEDLLLLSEYAVEGRYTIMHDDIQDVDKYIEILEKLIKFVKNEIKK
jgi:HEPN domain-containing protein